MFNQELDVSYTPANSNLPPSPATTEELQQWIEELQRQDRSLYNMMAMEAWAIAKTMDDMFPGFWHRYMTNRHQAMQQFQSQRRQKRALKKKPRL